MTNLALLLLMLGNSAPSLTYSGPSVAGAQRQPADKKAKPSEFELTQYVAGSKVWCAVDGANLRRGPSTEGEPIAQVPLGELVEVIAPSGEVVRLQDRVDRWYRVKTSVGTGYLFGNTLTPLAFTEDLDGDGKAERITVSWSAKMTPVVRLHDGEVKATAARLGQRGRTRGGTLSAAVRRAGKNVALELQSCTGARCKSTALTYDGDKVRAAGSVRSKPGEQVVGFAHGGVTLGSWKSLWVPVGSGLRRASCASPCRGDATLEPGPHEVVATIEIEGYPRGPSMAGPCTAIGTLRGKREGERLVSCMMREGGKASPEVFRDQLFAIGPPGRAAWTFVGPSKSIDEDVRAALKNAGIKPRGAKALSIIGLDPPEVLRGDNFGRLRLLRHDVRSLSEVDHARAFTDARMGPVYIGSTGAMIPHPHKGFWSYDYLDLPGVLVGTPDDTSYSHLSDADGFVRRADAIDVDKGTLVQEGRYEYGGKSRPLYRPKSASHPLYAALLEHHRNSEQMGWRPERAIPRTAAGLHEGRAIYIVYDGIARPVRLTRSDLVAPLLAEPIIYLYPTTTSEVSLTVDEVGFRASHPRTEGTTWSVVASPEGTLLHAGEQHDRLFWEGHGRALTLPEQGWTVPRARARAFLTTLARTHGLEGREVNEFVRAWAPRFVSERTEVRVYEDVDEKIPLRVTPAPDQLIRLYIDLRPARGRALTPPPTPALPARAGFVVVEWGGITSSLIHPR